MKRTTLLFVTAALATLATGVASQAQDTEKLTISAFAVNMGTIGTGANAVVDIAIDKWSTPEEREQQSAKQSSRDKAEDNRADVTNEALDRQKARAEKEKLHRVVFVKNGDKVVMKPVETGISDNTFIEIRKGITPGEEVVSGSYTAISRRLKDGAKVAIEKPNGRS